MGRYWLLLLCVSYIARPTEMFVHTIANLNLYMRIAFSDILDAPYNLRHGFRVFAA